MAEQGVTLSAGMRANLLSLQTTQRAMDRTNQHLSTGQRVNTAIEDPPVYFAAKSLIERANDLQALKDQMAQAVSTVKAADTGVSSIHSLIQQAYGLTTSAYANLADDTASQATRAALAKQFDNLRNQIDKTAQDSSYGGKNIVIGNGVSILPRTNEKISVQNIRGITKCDVTNNLATDNYNISVTGSGAISVNEEAAANCESELSIENLKVDGYLSDVAGSLSKLSISFNSLSDGSTKISLADADQVKFLVIKKSDIVNYVNNNQAYYVSETLQSGAKISFEIPQSTLENLDDYAINKQFSMSRNVDIAIAVTDQNGKSIERNGCSFSRENLLMAGENCFAFENGTVRLIIDEKTIKPQSTSSLGAFQISDVTGDNAPAITNIVSISGQDKNATYSLYVEKTFNSTLASQRIFLRRDDGSFSDPYIALPSDLASQKSFQFSDGSAVTLDIDPTKLRYTNELYFGSWGEPEGREIRATYDQRFDASGFSTPMQVSLQSDAADSAGAGLRTSPSISFPHPKRR